MIHSPVPFLTLPICEGLGSTLLLAPSTFRLMEKQYKGHFCTFRPRKLVSGRSQDLSGDPCFRRMPCLRDSDSSAGPSAVPASRSPAAAHSVQGEGRGLPRVRRPVHTAVLTRPGPACAPWVSATLSALCWAARPSEWWPLRSDPRKGSGCQARKTAWRWTHMLSPSAHRERDAERQEKYCLDTCCPRSFSI